MVEDKEATMDVEGLLLVPLENLTRTHLTGPQQLRHTETSNFKIRLRSFKYEYALVIVIKLFRTCWAADKKAVSSGDGNVRGLKLISYGLNLSELANVAAAEFPLKLPNDASDEDGGGGDDRAEATVDVTFCSDADPPDDDDVIRDADSKEAAARDVEDEDDDGTPFPPPLKLLSCNGEFP